MRRRSPVPHLILGILTVLALGAVALGLVLAPTTANLTAHNGAGEILLAGRVTALYSETGRSPGRFEYVAPDTLNVSLVNGTQSQTFRGSQVKAFFGPLTTVLSVTNFR